MRQAFLTGCACRKRWAHFMFKDWVGNDLKCRYIYICYVDRYIGAFNPYTWQIDYAPSEKFVPFVQKILKDYPEYSPHCVLNKSIENVIRDKIQADIRNLSTSKIAER